MFTIARVAIFLYILSLAARTFQSYLYFHTLKYTLFSLLFYCLFFTAHFSGHYQNKIYCLHAFKKKTRRTSKKDTEIIRKRYSEVKKS
ncbi:type II toxin-antitoxin system RelE/ParE family toxin [Kingella negevensis]|uniref:type II toxin-antitoxin system RelE/ParE family toxin n=1 Tax=Kingella negevensis TaxID=1522312 RepID=UPI003D6F647B